MLEFLLGAFVCVVSFLFLIFLAETGILLFIVSIGLIIVILKIFWAVGTAILN